MLKYAPLPFWQGLKNLFLAFLSLTCAISLGAKPPDDIRSRLKEWIKGKPSGIAVVWLDADGPAYFFAGRFSAKDNRPIGPDTQFALGSVSKVFTATLLAESERSGKVSRNDPVARYLMPANDPDQEALAKITLLALVTHRAGLPYSVPFDFGAVRPPADNPFSTWDRTDLVAGLRRIGPHAPVGRDMVYSNLGAALLGEALGSAWQTTYAEAVTARVLVPLGMRSTSLGLPGVPPSPQLAPAHVNGKIVPHWTLLAFAPAGAVRSTPTDMALFMGAALGFANSPIKAAMAETFTRQGEAELFSSQIGLAWFLVEQDNRRLAWHGGATMGTQAWIGFDLTSRRGVTILANSNHEIDSLGFALLGGKPPRNLRRDPPAVPNASDYVGRYILPSGVALEITERKGALYMHKTDTSTPESMRPVRGDRFAINLAPAEIVFQRGLDGKVDALTFDWAGRAQSAPRDRK